MYLVESNSSEESIFLHLSQDIVLADIISSERTEALPRVCLAEWVVDFPCPSKGFFGFLNLISMLLNNLLCRSNSRILQQIKYPLERMYYEQRPQ